MINNNIKQHFETNGAPNRSTNNLSHQKMSPFTAKEGMTAIAKTGLEAITLSVSEIPWIKNLVDDALKPILFKSVLPQTEDSELETEPVFVNSSGLQFRMRNNSTLPTTGDHNIDIKILAIK